MVAGARRLALLLFKNGRLSKALWAKVERHVGKRQLVIHWRSQAKNLGQRQCIMVCKQCKEATQLSYGSQEVEQQLRDVVAFLRLEIHQTGTMY